MKSIEQTTAFMDWHDGKRYLWLLSPAIPVLAVSFLLIYQFVWSWPWLLWGGPFLIYVLIPFADWVIGTDTNNPPESAVPQLEDDRYYRLIVYAYIPTQYLATVLGAWLVAQGNVPLWGLVGLVFSVGAVNGIAINTAHELGHKKGKTERWLAKINPGPGGLRPLLCGAQQGPPQERGHPGRSGQRPYGRILLAFPATHHDRQRQIRLAYRSPASGTLRGATVVTEE